MAKKRIVHYLNQFYAGIGGEDMVGLEKLIEGLSKMSDKVNFVLSVSADKADLPTSIETMATEI